MTCLIIKKKVVLKEIFNNAPPPSKIECTSLMLTRPPMFKKSSEKERPTRLVATITNL